AQPRPLHDRPPAERPPACDERAVPAVGGRRLAGPGRPGRPADGDLDGRLVRPAVGRPGPHLSDPPRDLEHQLGLSPVGRPALPGTSGCRRTGAPPRRRGVAARRRDRPPARPRAWKAPVSCRRPCQGFPFAPGFSPTAITPTLPTPPGPFPRRRLLVVRTYY